MAAGSYLLLNYGKALPGAAGSTTATISAVVKGNSASAPYCIPNELICSRIGQFVGLPLPPSGIVGGASGVVSFASLDFNLTGTSLPPIDVKKCWQVFPDVATGIVLFDIVIANSDRHASNLSADFSGAPPLMNVFDHSHALLGYQAGQGAKRLQDLRGRLGISAGPVSGGGSALST
jgi:hypothetical protein